MTKPIHLYKLDINPTTERHLLSLMQRHLKLAVESGNRQTSPERRAEIGIKIEACRNERYFIIEQLQAAKK